MHSHHRQVSAFMATPKTIAKFSTAGHMVTKIIMVQTPSFKMRYFTVSVMSEPGFRNLR
jgi:hypothetical protein